jgi:hypothetical protein
MDNQWTGVRWRHELYSTHEQEKWRRMFGNSVVRPRHELEVTNFTLVVRPFLNRKNHFIVNAMIPFQPVELLLHYYYYYI